MKRRHTRRLRAFHPCAFVLSVAVSGCDSLADATSASKDVVDLRAQVAAQGKLISELQEQRDSRLKVTWVPIELGFTGNETCGQSGRSCIAVSPSSAVDLDEKFCGYSIIDCNARVLRLPGCMHMRAGGVSNYVVRPAKFVQAPKAPGICYGNGELCMDHPIYRSAMCIDSSELRRVPAPEKEAIPVASATPTPMVEPAKTREPVTTAELAKTAASAKTPELAKTSDPAKAAGSAIPRYRRYDPDGPLDPAVRAILKPRRDRSERSPEYDPPANTDVTGPPSENPNE